MIQYAFAASPQLALLAAQRQSDGSEIPFPLLCCQASVMDARFCKPLDTQLIRQLAQNHPVMVTVEEGAVGGFAAHVMVSHVLLRDVMPQVPALLQHKHRGVVRRRRLCCACHGAFFTLCGFDWVVRVGCRPLVLTTSRVAVGDLHTQPRGLTSKAEVWDHMNPGLQEAKHLARPSDSRPGTRFR